MATSQVETVMSAGDKAKLALSVGLVVAALAGFYLLGKQGALVQWGALLAGFVAGGGRYGPELNRGGLLASIVGAMVLIFLGRHLF